METCLQLTNQKLILNLLFQPMKRTLQVETDNLEISAETENLIKTTPTRMSDHEAENSSSV